MSKTAWLVWRGEYSSAEVLGVYLTEDEAEQACDFLNTKKPKYGYDTAYIETAALNPPVPQVSDDVVFWLVAPSLDNAIEWESQLVDADEDGSIYVWARDKAHAIKIAQDRMAQRHAEEAGIA
jgi:hypothetical protein